MSRLEWRCPNGDDLDHVLICGGPDPNAADADAPNVYFQASLTGEYLPLWADGTPGVGKDQFEHADEGCGTEPICPVCKDECEQVSVPDDEGDA